MELLTQDFSRVVRRESSVNMASIERNVAFSLSLSFFYSKKSLYKLERPVCVNADDLS